MANDLETTPVTDTVGYARVAVARPVLPGRTRLGLVGLVIALIGFMAAVIGPYAGDALRPPPRPVDEVVAGTAGKLKDRLVAKLKGKPYVPPVVAPPPRDWSKVYDVCVSALGAVTVGIGVIGWVRYDNRRLALVTIALGAGTILMHYAVFIVMGAVLVALLVVLFFSGLT